MIPAKFVAAPPRATVATVRRNTKPEIDQVKEDEGPAYLDSKTMEGESCKQSISIQVFCATGALMTDYHPCQASENCMCDNDSVEFRPRAARRGSLRYRAR